MFGSPLAHEDDAARAAAAALELRDLEKTTAAREIQVGMSQGRLRSGTYGHEMRRTFVCLGDAVNLAARLMSAAPRERIYVSGPVREAAGEAFIWERLPDLKLKGKADPVEVWSLDGSLERASRRKTRFELGLVGRQRELGLLEARMAEAVEGRGRVVGIAAEAGMGKSRLVAEFVRNVRRRGHTVAFGECQAYGTKTPYFVWREIWRRLFGLEDDDPRERQVAALERQLAAIDPALVARAPLLSEVVGLSIPDSDLTRAFDAKLRKTSLEDLLLTCLRARALEAPFVAVLEDCHWIDELSRDLLQVLARATAALPVLFVARLPARGGAGRRARRGAAARLLASSPSTGWSPTRSPSSSAPRWSSSSARTPRSRIRSSSSSRRGPRATRSTSRSSSTTSSPGHRRRRPRRDRGRPPAGEPPHAGPEPHRRGRRGAAPDHEGGERRRAACSRPRSSRAPTRSWAASTPCSATWTSCGRSTSWRSIARPTRHGCSSTSSPRRSPTRASRSRCGRCSTGASATTSSAPRRTTSSTSFRCWSTTTGAATARRRSASTCARPPKAQAAYANKAAIAYYERLIPLLDGLERVDEMLMLAKVLQLTGDLAASGVAAEARGLGVALGDPATVARCDH